MEIQIPVADQDSASESQVTDRTECQSVSDNWSCDSRVSTSALPSRSRPHSNVSQPPLDSVAETDAEHRGANQDDDETGVVDSVGDTQTRRHPTGGGVDTGGADSSEKSYNPTEEMANRDLVTAEPSDRPGKQETADGEDTEITGQKPPEAEGDDKTLDAEEISGEACKVDSPEEETKDPNQEDGSENKGSEDNPWGETADADTEHEADKQAEEKTGDGERSGLEADGRVFLTENDIVEEGSDISDVRAETPDWAEEGGEERDGGSVSDEGEVAQKRNCHSVRSLVRPLTRSSLHEDIAPGQRAVVNTPVSYYTTTDLNVETARNVESRNTSHVETVREAVFQRAMTLMTSRCESKQENGREEGLFGINDNSYGYKYPQYFYVKQGKPSPMSPLKAWRGYHGNVYFEPIHISGMSGGGKGGKREIKETRDPPPSALSMSRKSSGSRRRVLTGSTRSQAVVPVPCGKDTDSTSLAGTHSPTRSATRLTFKRGPTSAKSGASSRSIAAVSQHHVLYLDKQVVAHSNNSAMQEEMQVMEKQQSTGSLNIQPQSQFPQDFRSPGGSEKGGRTVSRRSGASSAKFDRICRGSVVHKIRRAKSGGLLGNSMSRGRRDQNKENPMHNSVQAAELMIVGDRYASSSHLSPLLRTQTQFSLSNHRMTVNTPDLCGAFERLPPLEQVRISLRHMDARGDEGFGNRVASPYSTGTSVRVVEDLKPFIKYSPDVRAQYNHQIKYY